MHGLEDTFHGVEQKMKTGMDDVQKITKSRIFGIAILIMIGLIVVSLFFQYDKDFSLPFAVMVDDLMSSYRESIRHANYNASDVLDCNDENNPYFEYECFRDAFSSCHAAIVNPEIYTVEGDPVNVSLKISSDCKIQEIFDTSTDRLAVPETITAECESVGRGDDAWSIGSCDADNLPEMKFNFDMQLLTSQHQESNSYLNVKKLLSQNHIAYSDKLVVTSGATFEGDPGCGAVIDVDNATHWFKIDSISNPQTMTVLPENPNPCKVNTSSCFCNAQIELTALTLGKLSYFTSQEEEEYAMILLDYIQNNAAMKNIEPKFKMGKLNLNFTDPDAVGYCGERFGDHRNDFFRGAIVNGHVKDYSLERNMPLLCALNDDAKWWERK